MPTAVDAYNTVRNLSSDQIKSAFSEAQRYVSSEEGVERCFTVGTELGLGWLTAQGIGGVLGSAGEAAQTMRTATNVPQGVLMAGDGVVVAVEAAEAEAIANGIRTVGGALGRAAQAAGPASLVSQRGSDRQSQRSSERPPQSNAQNQAKSSVTDYPKAEKHPATPVGGKGKQFCVPDGTNQEALITGRIYCGHALDQMQERGIYPTMVEAAIKNGVKKAQQNGRIAYHDPISNLKVVVESTGKVVTIFFKTR